MGSALVRALLNRGEDVHVLARKSSHLVNLTGLKVQVHYGDVYYPESLRNAMKGAEVVYHTASVYRFFPWWKRTVPPIYKINIQGTQNVIQTAQEAGVKKLIYTSSIITMGIRKDGGLSNENTLLRKAQLASHYARSKYDAESLVLHEAGRGLLAVVVNPGMVIGPGDHKPTPSGEMIVKFLNRTYPGYFHTVFCLADVDDVAAGHIAAAEKGVVGSRYILCNQEHRSMKALFKILEKISGVRAPWIKFPYPLLLAFVYADEWSVRLIKHRPLMPSEGVNFCRSFLRCDNTKAVQELGYKTTPIEETLEKAVRWFRDHGYVHS